MKIDREKISDKELVDLVGSEKLPGDIPSAKSFQAQAELTRRLMESIKALESSTSRYSAGVIVLTFVLCVIAILQLATTVFPIPNYIAIRIILFGLFMGVIAWTFWLGVKDWKN